MKESEDETTLNKMKKEIEIIICFLLNSLERTSTNQYFLLKNVFFIAIA